MDIDSRIQTSERLIKEFKAKYNIYRSLIRKTPKGKKGHYTLVRKRANTSKLIKQLELINHDLHNKKYRLNDKDPLNASRCINLLAEVVASSFRHSVEDSNYGQSGCIHPDEVKRDKRWAKDFIYANGFMAESTEFYCAVMEIGSDDLVEMYEEWLEIEREEE